MSDSDFIDGEQINYGQENSVKSILLEQLRRIIKAGSQELRGGYWTEESVGRGNGISQVIRTYVPDSREEYTNSVNSMYDLIHPYLDDKVDKDLLEFEKKEKDEVSKIKNKILTDDDIKEKVEAFKNETVKQVVRYKFRILNKFLKRIDYLSSEEFQE